MSRDPNFRECTITDLRREFQEHGISGWFWGWLHWTLGEYVVARIAPKYEAALYAPGKCWDEDAVHDLVSGFIMEDAVPNGAIYRALVQDTLDDARRTLRWELRQHLVARYGKSLQRNVFGRLRAVLQESQTFQPLAGAGSRAAYGLAEWVSNPPQPADPPALRGAERHIPVDLPTKEYHSARRRSPVLERPALAEAAEAILRGVGRTLTARQILEVLKRRYDLSEPDEISGGSEVLNTLAVQGADPLDQVYAKEVAAQLISALTPRQRAILELWVGEETLTAREIADRLDLKKSTVNNEQRAIRSLAAQLELATPEECLQVFALLDEQLAS